MNKSESIKSIVAALAKAQSEFPPIPKDKTVTVTSRRTGGRYTFSYAPLETILSAIRPTLKANGLAFTQSVGSESMTTILMHTSGEWIESDPIPVRADSGDAQALGSAITYARRYSLTAALGIVAEDDDDGNTADGNHVETKTSTITPTTGYWESMPLDVQNTMMDTAHRVSTLLKRKDYKGAVAELTEATDQFEGRENYMAAQWTRFDSVERRALKDNGFHFDAKVKEAA